MSREDTEKMLQEEEARLVVLEAELDAAAKSWEQNEAALAKEKYFSLVPVSDDSLRRADLACEIAARKYRAASLRVSISLAWIRAHRASLQEEESLRVDETHAVYKIIDLDRDLVNVLRDIAIEEQRYKSI